MKQVFAFIVLCLPLISVVLAHVEQRLQMKTVRRLLDTLLLVLCAWVLDL